MEQAEFSAAIKGSPMKRVPRLHSGQAPLRGLKRNAAVVLGHFGTADDAGVLTRALEDPEPLVREHAEWALTRVAARDMEHGD
jgi:epoxyqueuosine reductase